MTATKGYSSGAVAGDPERGRTRGVGDPDRDQVADDDRCERNRAEPRRQAMAGTTPGPQAAT